MKPISSSDSFTKTTYSTDIDQKFRITSEQRKNKANQLAG
jgi:hypothetical protein